MIELSAVQTAPRQRQPSAVRQPWSPSAGVSRGARVAHANERSRRPTSPEPRRLGFKLPDFALGRGREGGTFSLIIVFLDIPRDVTKNPQREPGGPTLESLSELDPIEFSRVPRMCGINDERRD